MRRFLVDKPVFQSNNKDLLTKPRTKSSEIKVLAEMILKLIRFTICLLYVKMKDQ